METFDFAAFATQISIRTEKMLYEAAHYDGLLCYFPQIVDYVENKLSEMLTHEEKSRISCHAGCAHCCTVNVSVLKPEAVTIASYVQDNFSPTERALLQAKIAEQAVKVRWMEDEERIWRRIQCAFLDERSWCAIHPVRPLMCRSLTSTDSQDCRRFVESTFLDEERPIVCNLKHKYLLEAAYLGVAAALERSGLESRGLELASAVQELLLPPRQQVEGP